MRRILTLSGGAAALSVSLTWVLVVLRVPLPVAALLWAGLISTLAWTIAHVIEVFHLRARNSSRGLILLAAAIPSAVAMAPVSSWLVDNFRLAAFERQVLKLPVPPGARVVSVNSEVGALTGNGNHCDYIVGMEIETSQAIDSIRTHYQRYSLEPAIPGGADGGLPALQVSAAAPARTVRVEAIDAPYGAFFDFRCH